MGLAWGTKGPGPDRLGFGLGGQGSWAGPAWLAKGPGPDLLDFGFGGQGSWAGLARFLILRRTIIFRRSIFKKYHI